MVAKLIDVLRGVPAGAAALDEEVRRRQIAVVALLIEVSRSDGEIDPSERAAIVRLVEDGFELPAPDAAQLIALAAGRLDDTLDDWAFAAAIRDGFSRDERCKVVEMLWEVVYADGELTRVEEALMQRLSTAIGIDEDSLDAMRAEAFARCASADGRARRVAASYVNGASDQPLLGATLGQFFDAACARHGEREALIVRHQQARLSFTALRQRVDALACAFMRLGLAPGERIGIWSPNNLEWVLTQFATAKAGLVLVNVNPSYRRAELEYALNKSGCRALILASAFKSSDYLAMLADLAPELAQCAPGALRAERLPQLRMVIRLGDQTSAGMLNFDQLLSPPSDDELQALEERGERLQFDDPINIQFTSGTTGAPKGATLSHHNLLNNGFFVGEAMRLTPADRLCIPVPLYHCFGMVLGNLAALTHGATMVFPGEGFDALATLETVAEERCTALHGVPTMFIAMLDHPEFARFELGTLRTGIMAGSPCPIEVMKRVVSQMHMQQVTIAYGMTETSPVSFQSSTDDPLERRIATVGRIHPHVEVKVVDAEGRVVPRCTPGELLTRGYSVMLGYWDDEARTREAIDAAGWMHTGDLATIDKAGYCNIVGRIKDMVIRGGENVYPREIEEFLYRHPKVLEVQVVGVPDQRYGEELCAWIVVREGQQLDADEVRAFCQGQIAHYKIPRYIRFVDSFPMTVTGKIQKYVIRERMKQELGLAEAASA